MGNPNSDENPGPDDAGAGGNNYSEYFNLSGGKTEPDRDTPPEPSRAATAWEEFRDSLAQLGRTLWREGTDRRDPEWPPTWLRVSAMAAGLGALIFIVFPLLAWIARSAGSASAGLADKGFSWLVGLDLARIPVDAARDWITGHADTVGVEPGLLWWVAIGAAGLFFVFSVLGSGGARIGWTGCGVAAAAMAWAGPGGILAAAITIAWWCLLSILALHSLRGHVTVSIEREGTPAWLRDHAHQRRAAADVLDALAIALEDQGHHQGAADLRRTRSGVISTRAYGPESEAYRVDNHWYQLVARVRDEAFTRLTDETNTSD